MSLGSLSIVKVCLVNCLLSFQSPNSIAAMEEGEVGIGLILLSRLSVGSVLVHVLLWFLQEYLPL